MCIFFISLRSSGSITETYLFFCGFPPYSQECFVEFDCHGMVYKTTPHISFNFYLFFGLISTVYLENFLINPLAFSILLHFMYKLIFGA